MRGMIFCKRCGNYAADGAQSCPACSANLVDSGHSSLIGAPAVKPPPSPSSISATTVAMFGNESLSAGHLQRVLALLIDGLIQGMIVAGGVAGLIFVGGTSGLLILGLAGLASMAYEPYFIAAKGATPGKSAMHLRVVNKDGGPIGAGQSIARFLVKFVLNNCFIPLFVPLFSARHQGVHDMITSTYVVRG
jgi:uncharacterized RDD family membrane protein YckC